MGRLETSDKPMIEKLGWRPAWAFLGLANAYRERMSKRFWIAQRFLKNERGHYTVTGNCGVDRIVVEIDPSVVAGPGPAPERRLMKMRAQIQAAARHKWEAGEAYPVYHSHSGRMKHHAIALTAEDLPAPLLS